MSLDEKRYKQLFEQRFGSGSFDAGLSRAREIGQLQAQAEIAKQQYNQRIKESNKKSHEDALGLFEGSVYNQNAEHELEEMIKNPKKNGAARNAEAIRNDPSLQEAIKRRGVSVNEFIDAMYNAASGGQFRSERQFKGFNAELKKKNSAAKKKTEEKDILKKYNIDISGQSSKPKEKKDNKLLADIFTPLKQFGKGIKNVFDGDKSPSV